MREGILPPKPSHREKWLATLDKFGVGHPARLEVVDLPNGCVQATAGEPPGSVTLDPMGAHVLVMNLSPLQRATYVRDGHTFQGDALRGDLTLMPRAVASEWTWGNVCNRLDVIVTPEIFGDGSRLEVINRFQFRDPEIETICRQLYDEVLRDGGQDAAKRLYVESLTIQVAVLLLRRHSTASEAAKNLPASGLTRTQIRRVLDYIESNLNRELALRDLAATADLSLHHFARMFKQSMGAAPHRYVLERRVERAKEMLRSTGSSLVEISLSTGFCSQSHFTNTFRRMVGATPGEFRMES